VLAAVVIHVLVERPTISLGKKFKKSAAAGASKNPTVKTEPAA
jgi:hypothetical protein